MGREANYEAEVVLGGSYRCICRAVLLITHPLTHTQVVRGVEDPSTLISAHKKSQW